jgi:hypothetical protein
MQSDISKKNSNFIERMKKKLSNQTKFTDTFSDINKKKVQPVFIRKEIDVLAKDDEKFKSLLKTLYLGEELNDVDDNTFLTIITINKNLPTISPAEIGSESSSRPSSKQPSDKQPIDNKPDAEIHDRIFNQEFITDKLAKLAEKESNTIRKAVEKIRTYIRTNTSLYKFVIDYFNYSNLFTVFIDKYFKNKVPEDEPETEGNEFKVLSDEDEAKIKELQDLIIPMTTEVESYEDEIRSLNKDELVETLFQDMKKLDPKKRPYTFESFYEWETKQKNLNLPFEDKLKLFLNSRQDEFLINLLLNINFKDYFDAKKEINNIRISGFDYSNDKTPDKKFGLTKNELDLQSFLLYTVRKEDLDTWDEKDLKKYAVSKNITGDDSVKAILSSEFPDIQNKKFSLTKQQYRRVFDTLTEDQINVLAVKNNIKNFETKNRLDKTNLIIGVIFDKLKPIVSLSKNEIGLQNFLLYAVRKEMLKNLQQGELIAYAHTKNIKFTNSNDIIEKTLKNEFPDVRHIKVKRFFLTKEQYRRVFDTLTDEQVNVLALKNKIKNVETKSRSDKINLVIEKIFENLNPDERGVQPKSQEGNQEGRQEQYDDEDESFRKIPEPRKERSKELDRPVNEKAIQFITKELSKTLMKIAPTKKDYGYFTENRIADVGLIKVHEYNTAYMQILIKTLVEKSKTIRDLFRYGLEIMVNLNIPESKVFKHRVSKEYYLPDALASLSPSEMFSELYENSKNSSENVNKVSNEIQDKINAMISRFEKAYDYYIEPSLRKNPIYFPMNYSVSYRDQNRKGDCYNLNDVKNVNSENIVYYEEDGDLYCFDDEKFYSTVTGEERTNPITNKALDEEFIENFLKHFNPELSSEGLNSSRYDDYKKEYDILEKKEPKKSFFDLFTKELAPDLLSLVNDHLASLEDDAFGIKEYSEQSSSEQSSSEQSSSEQSSSEQSDPSQYLEKDYTPEKVVKELTNNPDELCGNCNKYKGQDSIKTIVRNKKTKQNRLVKFCDFACYKDWEVKKSMINFKQTVELKPVEVVEPKIVEKQVEVVVEPEIIEPVVEPKKKPKKVKPVEPVVEVEPVQVEEKPIEPEVVEPEIKKKPKKVKPVEEKTIQIEPVQPIQVEPTISNIVSDITKTTEVDDSTKNEIAKFIEEKIKDEIKKNKECPPGKILNPTTGRCIKDPKAPKQTPVKVNKKKDKECPPGKILNPNTGRCIKDPKVQKAPTRKVDSKKVSRKPVSRKKVSRKTVSRKVLTRKTVSRRKPASKKVSRKPVSRKPVSRKSRKTTKK